MPAEPYDDMADLVLAICPAEVGRRLVDGEVGHRGDARVERAEAAPLAPYRVAHDDEAQDLVALLPDAGRRTHRQRSWQHAQLARSGKALKRARLDVERSRDEAQGMRSQLMSAVASFPSLARTIVLPPSATSGEIDTHLQVQIVSRIATLPASAGATSHIHRSCAAFASTVLEVQNEVADRLLAPALAHDSGRSGFRVVVVSTQWDETMQAMRDPARQRRERGALISSQQVRIQVKVQSSKIGAYVFLNDGTSTSTEAPFFARAQYLWRQTGNYIIEALLRQMPLRVDDASRLAEVSGKSDMIVLAFVRDGAAANSVALEWFWDRLHALAPLNIIPISHLCTLHRVAISRSRIKKITALAAALQSFSKFIRVGKNLQALAASVRRVVQPMVRVVRASRPQIYKDRAKRLIELLYRGDGNDSYLYKNLPDGSREATSLLVDLESLLQVIDLRLPSDAGGDQPEGDVLIHWCAVEVGSEEHARGLLVGSPCCESAEQAFEKTVAPIQKWMAGKAWATMVLSRWTHVPISIKRALMLSVACNIFASALDDLRQSWDLQYSIERDLARMIAIDREDFAAQSRLRLLRMCKTLCRSDITIDMATGLLAAQPIDHIMYSIFGFERDRATIKDLMRPGSIITCAQERFWAMLSKFEPTEDNLWFPLALVGAGFNLESVRLQARAQVLQAAAGVCDALELRFSRPPYSLVVLCFADAAQAHDTVIRDFLSCPCECLSLGTWRIRQHCVTNDACKALLPPVMDAWASSSWASIDMSERAHAKMRGDLASSGPGRSPTLSSNRCMCREVHAHHVSLGGQDLHARSALRGGEPRARGPRSGVGGNPKMSFMNSKRRAYKALRAPNRPLTGQERSECDRQATEAWDMAGGDERALWRAQHFASNLGRQVAKVDALAAPPLSDNGFQGLWALSSSKHDIVPADIMTRHGLLRKTSRASDHLAWQDPSLSVADAPDRVSEINPRFRGHCDGCLGDKKNICRKHLLDKAAANELDSLTTLLSAYVDALGKDTVNSANNLIRFVGADSQAQFAQLEVTITIIGLLVDARYSPKMQYIVRCAAIDEENCAFQSAKPVPFMVSLCSSAPRLPGNAALQVLDLATSDEWCWALLQKKRCWRLGGVQHTTRCDTPDLLHMDVLGYEPLFETVVKRRAPKPTTMPTELDIDDPFGCGAAAVGEAASSRAAGPLQPMGAPGGEDDGDVDLSEMLNPDVFDDNCAEAVGEAWDDVERPKGIIDESDFAKLPDEGVQAENSGGVVMEEAISLLAAHAAAPAEAEDDDAPEEVRAPPAPPPLPGLEEVVAAATMDAGGYVRSQFMPFSSRDPAGRLTSWPKSKPLAQRSFSMRCYFHVGCSLAKGRHAMSDQGFLRWLFSAEVTPDADSATRRAQGVRHMAMAKAGGGPSRPSDGDGGAAAHGGASASEPPPAA